MKRITLLIAFVLLAGASVSAQQSIKSGGGEVTISRTGQTTIKSRSDKSVEIQSPTNITGATAITGAATVSTTLGVTGATTLTGGVTVGSTGTALTRIAKYTATLSPAEVAANTCAEELFTVTGVHASDIVFVNKPTAQAGLGVAGVRASATNQVGINFCNATASPITPTASQVYSFGVIR